jgi:hypothetical protein
MIQVSCPFCKTLVTSRDQAAGTVVACPSCRRHIKLPAQPTPAAGLARPVAGAAALPRPSQLKPVPVPAPGRAAPPMRPAQPGQAVWLDPASAGRRRRWTLPLAGFLVVAAAAVLAVGFLYPDLNPFQRSKPTELAQANNPPPVDSQPKESKQPDPPPQETTPGPKPAPRPPEPSPEPKTEPEPKSAPPEPQPEPPPPKPQPKPQPKAEPKEDVVTLVSQLKDKDPLVRLRAARELAALGPAAKLAIPALKEAAENDEDEVVRIAARRALQAAVDTQSKETLTTLLQQLQDKDPLVRLQAATKLGKLGASAKSALPALKQALTDSDEDVRLVARRSVEAIEQALAQEIKPILEQIQKDLKSKRVEDRLAAVESLRRLGGGGEAPHGAASGKHAGNQRAHGKVPRCPGEGTSRPAQADSDADRGSLFKKPHPGV